MRIRNCLPLLLLVSLAGGAADKAPPKCKSHPWHNMFSLRGLVPYMGISTSVRPDGARLFVFTMEWDEKQLNNVCLVDEPSRNSFVTEQIGRLLGERHWCETGWGITDRQIVEPVKGFQTLMVNGQCK